MVTLFQKLGKCVAWDWHTVLLGLGSSDLSPMAIGARITSGVALGGASAAIPKKGLARRKRLDSDADGRVKVRMAPKGTDTASGACEGLEAPDPRDEAESFVPTSSIGDPRFVECKHQ